MLKADIRSRTPKEELNDYLKDPITISDPLSWWKTYECKFPRLSKLVKNYLAVPTTSVPSERIFSAAGITVTKLRASLDRSTVDQIIFLTQKQLLKLGYLFPP